MRAAEKEAGLKIRVAKRSSKHQESLLGLLFWTVRPKRTHTAGSAGANVSVPKAGIPHVVSAGSDPFLGSSIPVARIYFSDFLSDHHIQKHGREKKKKRWHFKCSLLKVPVLPR